MSEFLSIKANSAVTGDEVRIWYMKVPDPTYFISEKWLYNVWVGDKMFSLHDFLAGLNITLEDCTAALTEPVVPRT